MAESDDPTNITAVAVRPEDAVAALEANQRGADRRNVLRITRPYSGRMRARLHREGSEEYEPGTDAIHLDPASLFDDPPELPHPDDTEDDLRADPDRTYDRTTHHEYHEQQVEQWRQALGTTFTDTVVLDTDRGPHEAELVVIGDP